MRKIKWLVERPDALGDTYDGGITASIEEVGVLIHETGAIEVTTGDDTVYEVPNA